MTMTQLELLPQLEIKCDYRHKVEGTNARCKLFTKKTKLPEALVNEQMCVACQGGKQKQVFDSLATHYNTKGRYYGEPEEPDEYTRICPFPQNRIAPKTRLRWATAIVTSPRPNVDYLPQTITALLEAGFPEPIIFAEPNSPVPKEWEKNTIRWLHPSGLKQNSMQAMSYMYWNHTIRNWDALYILEDDQETAPGTRHYLDYALWPCKPEELAFITLYVNTNTLPRHKPGWHRVPSCQGAQGLVVSRQGLARYLFNAFHITFQEKPLIKAEEYQDLSLWRYGQSQNYKMFMPVCNGQNGQSKSFVEHKGVVSSTFMGPRESVANDYLGTKLLTPLAKQRATVCVDCDDWFKKPEGVWGCASCSQVTENTLINPKLVCPKAKWP